MSDPTWVEFRPILLRAVPVAVVLWLLISVAIAAGGSPV